MLKYIILIFSLFFTNKSIALEVKPLIKFNCNYIFDTEISLNLSQNVYEDFELFGYIKRSSINGNFLYELINSKLDFIPNNIRTNNNNYFYEVGFKNKLYKGIYYTFSFYDSIKYNSSLIYFQENIYNYLKLRLDYYFYDFNFFTSFSKTFNGVKNNVNIGINKTFKFSNNQSIILQYDYYRDIKEKDKIILDFVQYKKYLSTSDYLYMSNNISILSRINIYDNSSFDVGFSYSFGFSYSSLKEFGDNYNIILSYNF